VGDAIPMPRDPADFREDLHFTDERRRELIAFLKEGDFHELFFHGGGEPFLSEDTIAMAQELIRETRMLYMQVNTNGEWAKDRDRLEEVLDGLDEAMLIRRMQDRAAGWSLKDFSFYFSINEYYDEENLKGIVNILELFAKRGGTLFPKSGVKGKLSFQAFRTKDARAAYELLNKMIGQRIEGASLRLGDLIQSLDPEIASLDYHGDAEGYVGFFTPDFGQWRLVYRIIPLFSCKRVRSMVASGALRIEDIRPFMARLAQKNVRVGTYFEDFLHTHLYSSVIDADGSVCLSCRDVQGSKAFVSANIRDGFAAVESNEAKCPIFRNIREKGTYSIIDLLPGCFERYGRTPVVYDENTLPYVLLDEILADEALRMHVLFAALRAYSWNELTEDSQRRLESLEKEMLVRIDSPIPEALFAGTAAAHVPSADTELRIATCA